MEAWADLSADPYDLLFDTFEHIEPLHPQMEPSNTAVLDRKSTETIAAFVERNVKEATSPSFLVDQENAKRAEKLGFTKTSDNRLAAYRSSFLEYPHLREKYEKDYPNSRFLPWAGFHAVRKALNLHTDTLNHYRGAVPPSQLGYMEAFELQPVHNVNKAEILCLMDCDSTGKGAAPRISDAAAEMSTYRARIRGVAKQNASVVISDFSFMYNGAEAAREREDYKRRRAEYEETMFESHSKRLESNCTTMQNQMFILAPNAAFDVKDDFIERCKKDGTSATQILPVPHDPLVVKFVQGGALVVASWGDEAAHLNEICRDLGI